MLWVGEPVGVDQARRVVVGLLRTPCSSASWVCIAWSPLWIAPQYRCNPRLRNATALRSIRHRDNRNCYFLCNRLHCELIGMEEQTHERIPDARVGSLHQRQG